MQVAFNVKNSQGQCLANLNSNDTGLEEMDLRAQGYFECDWPRFQLRAGRYDCDLFCTVNQEIADWVENAFVLEVVDGDYYGTGRLIARNQGEILIDHRWRHSGRQG